MTPLPRFVFVSAAALAFSGLIQAQTPVPRDPERQKVERADAALKDFEDTEITDPTVFVKSAALGAMTGIELAKVAQSKSQDAGIKGFAARVIKDHNALYKELAAIAKRKRLDVPTSLVYEDEQMLTQAAEKSGAEFDAWYARQMMTEHQKAIALFQGAAKMQDAELAAFAKKTLPALDEQRRIAITLAGAARP